MKARHKHSRKPESVKNKAAELHLAGMSARAIAKELGVDKDTVGTLVEDSEVIKEYRRRLKTRIEPSLRALDKALGDNTRKDLRLKAALWTLENTQVGVTKEQHEVSEVKDEFAGRTRDELLFFATHGHWPRPSEEEGAGKATCHPVDRA